MKKIILIAAMAIYANFAYADYYTHGYYQTDSGYTNGYYSSSPNRTNLDNYSTRGNYNPYTGSQGTRARDYSPEAYNYGSGREIYVGPRGGQYYYNDNGRKVYVPKRY